MRYRFSVKADLYFDVDAPDREAATLRAREMVREVDIRPTELPNGQVYLELGSAQNPTLEREVTNR